MLDDYYSKEQFAAVGNLLCPHIPKNLGPKDPMKAGCDLVGCCREDDETSQMVLDESSHFGGIFLRGFSLIVEMENVCEIKRLKDYRSPYGSFSINFVLRELVG